MQPDFPGGSDGKASAYNVGDPVQSPGRKISWRRKWNPLQHSCLENPLDGGAWSATVHGVAKSRTQLIDFTHSYVTYSKVLLGYNLFFVEGGQQIIPSDLLVNSFSQRAS